MHVPQAVHSSLITCAIISKFSVIKNYLIGGKYINVSIRIIDTIKFKFILNSKQKISKSYTI
ncbi:MAG: hypothetical protein AUJ98_05960 [Bacteroidetes bacterium CG2_30_33_31]|nr:MAG: hypothetical protein AUJ98_05960 [Bacteroidetes bacterium CG2_30_33_31]